jgi:hypothetical protein
LAGALCSGGSRGAERIHECSGGFKALLGTLGEHTRDSGFNSAGEIWAHTPQWRWFVVDLTMQHRDAGIGLKWDTPGKHLEGNDAQGVQIGAVVDRLPLDLLGRHVFWSTGDCPEPCQTSGVGRMRDAEVGQTGLVASGTQENIAWLQISMNDAKSVGIIERLGDL